MKLDKIHNQFEIMPFQIVQRSINILWNDGKWYVGKITSQKGTVLKVHYAGTPILSYDLKKHKEGTEWKMCTKPTDAYKGSVSRKNLQNENLVHAFVKHCKGSSSRARACVIDAETANSTRALIEAGFNTKNITVANWNESISESIRSRTGATVKTGSFLMALAHGAHVKHKYDVVYADFCGMLKGTHRAAIALLFDSTLLKPRSVLAITICARLNKRSKLSFAAARDAHSFVKRLAKKNGYVISTSTMPSKSHYTEKGKATMSHLMFEVLR
jgi:ribosomal protein S6